MLREKCTSGLYCLINGSRNCDDPKEICSRVVLERILPIDVLVLEDEAPMIKLSSACGVPATREKENLTFRGGRRRSRETNE